jgi:microcin C transport system substrate-binding protein
LRISRRQLLQSSTLAALTPALSTLAGVPFIETAQAQAPADLKWRHALSLFGDIKYPADFKRFDYVNPNAPKGGSVRQSQSGTFDNFNIVVASFKGNSAQGTGYIYETLTTQSLDEPDANYGLLAEAAAYPDDRSYVIYRLRAGARWHDGQPVTPDDVIFSFDALKKYSPMYSAYWRHIVKCEKVGDRDVKFSFDGPGNRELPTIAGQVTVLPKHWWEGTDAKGKKRDISETTLEIPLGVGALPHQGIRRRPFAHARAREGPLGQGSAGLYRSEQFRRAALGLFPRRPAGPRSLQGGCAGLDG